MDINNIEKELLSNEVGTEFLPWIGNDCEFGVTYTPKGELVYGTKQDPGVRLLALGESHYADDFDKTDPKFHDFTKEVVRDYLAGRSGKQNFQRWMNTLLKFERSISGNETSGLESQEIWNHLAFYNFLQTPLSMPRMQPNDTELVESKKPFFKVLDLLEPDIILVWGRRLYSSLPMESDYFTGKEGEGIYIDGYRADSLIYCKKNGHQSLAISLYHPSVGFDWRFWNSIIKKGVANV